VKKKRGWRTPSLASRVRPSERHLILPMSSPSRPVGDDGLVRRRPVGEAVTDASVPPGCRNSSSAERNGQNVASIATRQNARLKISCAPVGRLQNRGRTDGTYHWRDRRLSSASTWVADTDRTVPSASVAVRTSVHPRGVSSVASTSRVRRGCLWRCLVVPAVYVRVVTEERSMFQSGIRTRVASSHALH